MSDIIAEWYTTDFPIDRRDLTYYFTECYMKQHNGQVPEVETILHDVQLYKDTGWMPPYVYECWVYDEKA